MSDRQPVQVVDIDIPFFRLMTIIIKVTLAAIPAAIIVSVILSLVMGALATVFGIGMGPWMHGGRTL
ncbi:hypothetical protein [Stappia sp.]|jgi:hypothetical protein|uniref:hypothetical protein n=1 Tax=Stappia sp. TaxID=1870903 RepID=UPI003D10FC46